MSAVVAMNEETRRIEQFNDIKTNGYATFVMRALREVWIAHPSGRRRNT